MYHRPVWIHVLEGMMFIICLSIRIHVRIEIYWEFYHGIIYIANEDILLELLWNVVKAIIQLTNERKGYWYTNSSKLLDIMITYHNKVKFDFTLYPSRVIPLLLLKITNLFCVCMISVVLWWEHVTFWWDNDIVFCFALDQHIWVIFVL
jgi:hypothetical protein